MPREVEEVKLRKIKPKKILKLLKTNNQQLQSPMLANLSKSK